MSYKQVFGCVVVLLVKIQWCSAQNFEAQLIRDIEPVTHSLVYLCREALLKRDSVDKHITLQEWGVPKECEQLVRDCESVVFSNARAPDIKHVSIIGESPTLDKFQGLIFNSVGAVSNEKLQLANNCNEYSNSNEKVRFPSGNGLTLQTGVRRYLANQAVANQAVANPNGAIIKDAPLSIVIVLVISSEDGNTHICETLRVEKLAGSWRLVLVNGKKFSEQKQ